MPRSRCLPGRPALLVVPIALALGSLPAAALPLMPAELPLLAQAQTEPQMQTPPPAEGDVSGYSQDQLQAYANAVMKIQEIDQAWQPRIDQAENEQEAEEMTTEATNEMVGEIEAQGLSVEEYNAITQDAQRDNQLYNHILTLLAQAR